MKHIFLGGLLVALALVVSPAKAEAQYYFGGQPQSEQELIQYLYQLINQLQNQTGGGSTVFVPSTPTFSSSGVDVDTLRAGNIDDDSASMYGEGDLNNAAYADVYFEFGTSRSNLNQRSLIGRATTRTADVFRSDVFGLRDDETYYFRAVARDAAGNRSYGSVESFQTDDNGRSSVSRARSNSSNDDEPDVETDSADDVEDDRAVLRGEVDMNDFRNGVVFFAYGEDEDQVEDIADEHDQFSDIDEDGDDLQLIRVDRDLDGREDYRRTILGLDDNTDYFFSICVEYEDDDDDEVIECGGVEDFETDDDNGSSSRNDDEPEASTDDADDVRDDEVELAGDVDMNDFDNGLVFFVYGEDEDLVEDVEDDFDTFSDVDEEGDDLQKVRVDSDLDGSSDYTERVTGLDEDTDYFFSICVEYEDDDDDDVIVCGGVEEFTTDD